MDEVVALVREDGRGTTTIVKRLPDDPNAALDARAEAEVFARLRRTALLVSHRFSSVCRADWIVVLSDGRVQEAGQHEGSSRGGRDAERFGLQAAVYR